MSDKALDYLIVRILLLISAGCVLGLMYWVYLAVWALEHV